MIEPGLPPLRLLNTLTGQVADFRPAPAALELGQASPAITEDAVRALMDERSQARAARDFGRSDQIRAELARVGVTVEDHRGGTASWRWSRPR